MKKLFLIVFAFLYTFSYSQDGSFDISFGDNGRTQFTYNNNYKFYTCNQLSDDSYFTFGKHVEAGNYSLVIHKILNDGNIDTSFGVDGIVVIPWDSQDNPFKSITVNNDKTLLLKNKQYHLTINRIDSNGSLDNSFGNNGELTPFPSSTYGSMTILESEKILAATSINTNTFSIRRFLADGELDLGFGNNGEITISLSNLINFEIVDIKETIDNKILVSLIIYNYPELDENYILKINPNGELDTSFGSSGIFTVPIEFIAEFTNYSSRINLFENGEILVSTYIVNHYNEFYYTKYRKLNSQGVLIPSFGNGGSFLEFGVGSVKILQNQRFIHGSQRNIKRYFSGGDIDNSFNMDFSGFPPTDEFYYIVDNVGKIFFGTRSYFGPTLFIARLNNNPLNLSSFDINAIFVSPNPSSSKFTINSDIPFENTPFKIYDFTGKNVGEGFLNGQNPVLDLTTFQSGIYLLKINNSTLKLIKN
ncbi:MAG: T9SS type A sorting domain-containing protein [Flavobacteriaceae bacterium]